MVWKMSGREKWSERGVSGREKRREWSGSRVEWQRVVVDGGGREGRGRGGGGGVMFQCIAVWYSAVQYSVVCSIA